MFNENVIGTIGEHIRLGMNCVSGENEFVGDGKVKWSKINARYESFIKSGMTKIQFNEFYDSIKLFVTNYEGFIFLKKLNCNWNKRAKKFKMIIEFVSTDDKGRTLEQINWERLVGKGKFSSLNKEWFGKSFKASGRIYKITGLSPNRRKYPVNIHDKYSNSKRVGTIFFVKENMELNEVKK